MEEKWACPFHVDVDTNLAALAEYDALTEKPSRLLYITLSTGMGGGLILDGHIYRGMKGGHPEIGHQTVCYRSPGMKPVVCPCGAEGCLEALVSGNGIRRLYGKLPEELGPDEWNEVAWNLGQGLRNLTAIHLPDVIILGGGISSGAQDKWLKQSVRVMSENVKIVAVPKVQISRLGDGNVFKGALLLAQNRTA